MSNVGSPLGRYAEPAALITAMAVTFAWLLVQLGVIAPGTNPAELSAVAALAVGILLGQRATTNGAGKIAGAAHRRLDAIGAPPTPDPGA